MTDTTGNFNDLVQLSGDTLYHLGEEFVVGNSAASTLTQGFSNSGGMLNLIAQHTTNESLYYPTNTTLATLLTAINISAGTTQGDLSAVTFSNSNNVSFGLNASTITGSVSVATLSNSNNITFGLAGSVITASYNFNISAGTTSQNLNAVTFSNSNAISFGLSGSVVTATMASSQDSIGISAGTTSNLLSAFTLSNSNNVSFGLSASTVTASYALNVSAGGGTSNALSAITFSTSNNVSFGLSTGAGVGTMTAFAGLLVSAGTTTLLRSAYTFSNSNGFSFGMNNATITGAYGGFSSWQNGLPSSGTNQMGSVTLYLQPIVIPYFLSAANLMYLASVSASAGTSGSFTMSVGLYSISGGTAGSLSQASSSSAAFTWSSASSSNFTGNQYRSVGIAWSITPGPYVMAMAWSGANTASVTYAVLPIVATGAGGATNIVDPAGKLTNQVLPGFSVSTVAALPTSIAISATGSYIRTGEAFVQPWFLLQGT
jgi:hypothetical protein